jgi:hypothetical protein
MSNEAYEIPVDRFDYLILWHWFESIYILAYCYRLVQSFFAPSSGIRNRSMFRCIGSILQGTIGKLYRFGPSACKALRSGAKRALSGPRYLLLNKALSCDRWITTLPKKRRNKPEMIYV